MKYLTEDDLRLKYNDFPFKSFTIEKNTRLTPGAKTFLIDRKIDIIDDQIQVADRYKKSPAIKKSKEETPNEECTNSLFETSDGLLLRCDFTKVAFDLVRIDPMLAQELSLLGRFLGSKIKTEDIVSLPQLKITKSAEVVDRDAIISNFSTISMLLQFEKGRILSQLYPLYFRLEAFSINSNENELKVINLVIQRLGQLIVYYLNKCEEINDEANRAI